MQRSKVELLSWLLYDLRQMSRDRSEALQQDVRKSQRSLTAPSEGMDGAMHFSTVPRIAIRLFFQKIEAIENLLKCGLSSYLSFEMQYTPTSTPPVFGLTTMMAKAKKQLTSRYSLSLSPSSFEIHPLARARPPRLHEFSISLVSRSKRLGGSA